MVRPSGLVKIGRRGEIFRYAFKICTRYVQDIHLKMKSRYFEGVTSSDFGFKIYTRYIQDIHLKIKTRYFEGFTSSDLCFKIYIWCIQDIHLKMRSRWLEDIYMIYPKGTYVM